MCHFKLTTYDLDLNLKARFGENMILNSVNSLPGQSGPGSLVSCLDSRRHARRSNVRNDKTKSEILSKIDLDFLFS